MVVITNQVVAMVAITNSVMLNLIEYTYYDWLMYLSGHRYSI